MQKILAALICLSLAACSQVSPLVIPSVPFSASPNATLSASPVPTLSPSSTPVPLPTTAPRPFPTPVRELTDAFAKTEAPDPSDTLLPAVALPPALAGLKIVMVSDQRLVLWDDGTPALLFEGNPGETISHPRFSPDGQYVAFRCKGELWIVDADGKNPRKLVSTGQSAEISKTFEPTPYPVHGINDFAWLPGTQTLLFNMFSGDLMPGPTKDLYRIDVQGGAVRMLLPPGKGGTDIYPSPDGKKVALVTETQVVMADQDGANRRVALAFEMIHTYSEFFHYPVLQWESGSGAAYLTVPPQLDPISPILPARVWRLPVNGNPRLAGEFWTSEKAVFVSPGSPYLIYYDGLAIPARPDNATPAVPKVVLRNLATGSEKPLADSGSRVACWTADGRYALMDTAEKLAELDVQGMAITKHSRISFERIICLNGTYYLGLYWLWQTNNLELASLDGTTYTLGPLNGIDDLDFSFQ